MNNSNKINRRQFLKLTSMATATTLSLSMGFPILGHAYTAENLTDDSQFDVIIIGTGYGAAVTALRLAEKGIRCLMLEMGLDWQEQNKQTGLKFSGMAWAEKQSTWLRKTTIAPFANYRVFEKFTGALDRIDFEHVHVYAGRGIGGGSLVNGGMSVTPTQAYFEEIFPQLDSQLFYRKYFPLANASLGVSTIPDDFYQSSAYYQFSRTGEAEGIKAGYTPVKVPNVYDYDYMRKEEAGEVTKSGLSDEVIYGNNYGKKDLTKTYLKQALATGNVTILGLHKVEQIVENLSKETNAISYSIKVSQINTKGETVKNKTYHTNKLFLGAGSLGTTELLLKSQAKGTLNHIDSEVGKYWGNNGNVMATRSGIKKPLGKKQAAIPAVGLSKWTKDKDAVFAEVAPFPVGIDFRTALYLVINRVSKYGKLSYNHKQNKLALNWDNNHTEQMVKNAGMFLDTMNAANGGLRGAIFRHGKDWGINPKICYHPLGGCVLGKATDQFGRLKNYQGLYITDGALIPASIGVNPYVTITALAEYCIENVLQQDFKDELKHT
ncbi:GMC oxidoreductase [Psychrobacter sp. HD31]|uniref:GMC oxidoreductase n=1 Tax=Psychrobacter sp. HD31 TaxID=3112003 RepID=UPI003DA53483